MKSIKRSLLYMFLLAVMLLAIPTQASAAVKLNKTTVTLTVGQSMNLKVEGTKKKVKWSSNKKSVATVNSSGKVTAKKKGSATITAKIGSKKYKCKVTVKEKGTPVFENMPEKGAGTFYIYFASGTSENGKIPNVYVDKNLVFGYVDYCAYDVDDSVPIHIYIDGKQVDVDYVGFKIQKSLSFSGDEMKKGTHTVEMVQYAGNNTNGEVITYRKTKYKVLYK